MRTLLVLAVVAGILVIPSWGVAQYYGYYSPYFTAPPPQPAPPQVGGQPPKRTLYYRMAPDPLLLWKWNRYNAYQDFQMFQRSPLNPESDLSYMLRTF